MKGNAAGPFVLSLFFVAASGLALVLALHFNWEGENYVLGAFVLSLCYVAYVLYAISRDRSRPRQGR